MYKGSGEMANVLMFGSTSTVPSVTLRCECGSASSASSASSVSLRWNGGSAVIVGRVTERVTERESGRGGLPTKKWRAICLWCVVVVEPPIEFPRADVILSRDILVSHS
jgi:hypothetical protein